MINEYGNDAKNNIMFNEIYPFIPECTNDFGITFNEMDNVFITMNCWNSKLTPHICQAVVYKIYNKDHAIVYVETEGKNNFAFYCCSLNELTHNHGKCKVPFYDLDKVVYYSVFNNWLNRIYHSVYGPEIFEDPHLYANYYYKDLERLGLKPLSPRKY